MKHPYSKPEPRRLDDDRPAFELIDILSLLAIAAFMAVGVLLWP